MQKVQRRLLSVGGGIGGGGWDTQLRSCIYPHIRQKLVNNGRNSSIGVDYRYPTHLDESIIDIISGIEFLEHAGIQPVGFVGHSLGGSVVIEAAAAVVLPI
jgi:pimeloyl-ACP methyl ester carboxylesterase